MSTHQTWSIDELRHLVPDVRQPLDSGCVPADAKLPLYQRQRHRKAIILSLARAQLDEGSMEINVRELAERSGLCVQTIYNLVGGKNEILAAAVDEHYRRVLSLLDQVDAGRRVFSLLAELLWAPAWKNPCYIRTLSRRYFERADDVHTVIQQRVQDTFVRALRGYLGYREDDLTLRWVAEKMHALIAISSLEWVHERSTLDGLRERLLSDFDLVLRTVGGIEHSLRMH
jgi:AcrR family transcriptional regulator